MTIMQRIKRLQCFFGHRWVFVSYEDAPKGWVYENKRCTRCNAHSRELTASMLG